MRKCALCQKKELSGNGTFFSIPKDDRRRSVWSANCQRNFSATDRICIEHFRPEDIIRGAKKMNLMPCAVPHFWALPDSPMPSTVPCKSVFSGASLCSITEIVDNSHHEISLQELGTPKEVASVVHKIIVEYTDQGTQTDPIMFETAMDVDLKKQKADIKKLNKEIDRLEGELRRAKASVTALSSVFTEGQIKKLHAPGRIEWKWEDISNAICLHAAGPRAYNHLYGKGFPLPHISTLQRWYRKVDISEGIIGTAIDFMRQITDLETDDKMCVLAFDEMKVAEAYEYDAVGDHVRKPTNFVQVVIARGLRKSWKQPIFFDYDCKMTVNILYSIIGKLQDAGFPVVAIVCDLGGPNRKLYTDLGVTMDRPWFPNPVQRNAKVFAFADAPHLLKLIRNHFLDTGLIWKGKILTSRTMTDVLKHTSASDMSITYKLTNEHLSVKGPGRQKVKLAAQLFSNTTANAIKRCYSLGLEVYEPINTADMVQLINDWFDVFNSTMSTFTNPGKEPYGLALAQQRNKLHEMREYMRSNILPNKKSLEFFQKGVIISINALMQLHEYVKENCNMSYILTNRLNQDIVEHFFGAIRSKGGLYDHPTPKEFKYRLRKYILARNTEHLHGKGNVETDSTDWLNTSYTNSCCSNNLLSCNEEEMEAKENVDDPINEIDDEIVNDIGVLQEDALEYVSGYIVRKLNLEEHQCQENSFTWVDQVSKGHLKKPSTELLECIKKLEVVFQNVNGEKIAHVPNLQERLFQRSEGIILDEKIKKFFFKCRIHFRVRSLNKRLKVQKAKQRIMGYKKMLKINL